jgi:phage-related protein
LLRFGLEDAYGVAYMKRFRWRDYQTAAGARPVKDYFDRLTDEEVAAIVAAMKEVGQLGLGRSRHLRGDIYEVRADGDRRSFRVLFAQETKFILLSLSVFEKRTQKTPVRELDLAERRLRDWRARGGS